VPIVNSAPSSGCWVGFPPIAATASGNQSGVALPPASPLSRVCPRRWGGSPSGDLSAPPALSLRGWELEVLIRPPSAGRTREGDFPPLVTPVADEGGFTNVSLVTSSTLSKPSDFRSKDVARGFTGNPLTPDRGLSSILQLIRNRLGCSPTVLLTENVELRDALLLSTTTRWLTTYRPLYSSTKLQHRS